MKKEQKTTTNSNNNNNTRKNAIENNDLDSEEYTLDFDPKPYVYTEDEIEQNCCGKRRPNRCYSCVKRCHFCFPLCYNLRGYTKYYTKSGFKYFINNCIKYKYLIFLSLLYAITSALCTLLKIRIYKQMLIYSFVYELVVSNLMQFVFMLPIAVFCSCAPLFNKFASFFYAKKNNTDEIENNKSENKRNEIMENTGDIEINLIVNEEIPSKRRGNKKRNTKGMKDDDDNNSDNDGKIISSSSEEGEEGESTNNELIEKSTKKYEHVSTCYFTSSETKICILISFLNVINSTMKVLPIMILPPILITMLNQFGLIFILLLSFLFINRKCDVIPTLCVIVITMGLFQSIVPDTTEALNYSKDFSHDLFWRNTIYHNFNETPINHMRHIFDDPSQYTKQFELISHDQFDIQSIYNISSSSNDNKNAIKNTVIYKGHYLNSSILDLSNCLSRYNLSIEQDESLTYEKYYSAVNQIDVVWWKKYHISFYFCITLALLSTLPESSIYIFLEKYWKLKKKTLLSSPKITNESCLSPSLSGCELLFMVFKTTFFKLLWILIFLPLFSLSNPNWGYYHYFKYGMDCSFDNLYYIVIGKIMENGHVDVESIKMEGDYLENSYWECSPWRNGLNCYNMNYMTIFSCFLEIILHVLYLKIISLTTNAKFTWLLGIIKVGIINILFSIPVVSGSLFVEYRYYDILSLITIFCATFVYWFYYAKDLQ